MTGQTGPLLDIAVAMREIWVDQTRYNDAIKAIRAGEVQSWPEVYAIGVHEEVSEVMRVSKWKYHKPGRRGKVDREALADELADTTKYLLSLWQEFGFSLPEMLQAITLKSHRLEVGLTNDWFPPEGTNVLVTDLDGTVADWRTGFAKGAGIQDNVRSLAVDLDNGLGWASYERAKGAWEEGGGYATLPPYGDAVTLLQNEWRRGTWVIVVTARPADTIHRIWRDTDEWLQTNGVKYQALLMGRDERLVQLLRLAERRNRVLLLEDDPVLAERAAGAGFRVWMRAQPYNRHVRHGRIARWSAFPEWIDWEAHDARL